MHALVLVGLRGLTTWPDSDKVPVAQASERRLGRFSGIGRATVIGDDLAGCGLITFMGHIHSPRIHPHTINIPAASHNIKNGRTITANVRIAELGLSVKEASPKVC
jgi:hypothetical protein